ncbi:MAG TPA: FprA family A-type flavoprotein [Bacteroidales bacterium]|nr:FprA family A-type flavoprotein [Bacteroidales bacterium]HOL96897.1 FprA family A-type flavoprotein [Bacteroidales bacterium]HPD25051.1 FprA family A-type flavoprotein [Bacteroidales bacterium]HRS98454.1 FprA family A-type flavoprotein [Bacteroidales bacterium]HUM33596.1 FprA family A-type flavoprotein [Bacteroidales bacterium]
MNINMNEKVLNVTDNVKWIGILDFDIVTFDIVMETKYGTTYNSYFIDAEKKAIVETVKEKFASEYIEKIKSVVNASEIEYIILDHTEPDHSGSLGKLLEIAPNATVVGSGNAIRYLQDMFPVNFKHLIVKDGDELNLGNKTLKFIAAPNLHWPDSIYTYLVEDKVLFTCDSFGAHFCKEEMFDDLVGDYYDAFKYYFDVILKPYSKFMLKSIEKIRPLEINVIATGHGPILRTRHQEIINLTEKLSKEYVLLSEHQNKKVLITYVSAYGYTGEMANAIAEGIKLSGNVDVEVMDIEKIDLGELDSKLVLSDAILIGSPTINQNTLLPIYKLFALINPIRDRSKLAGAFGSFGWSGGATEIINANLKSLKLNVVEDVPAMKFRANQEQKNQLIEFGKSFAAKLVNN